MFRPAIGSRVTVDRDTYGEEQVQATVELHLSTQFTATWEERRPDGGTVERLGYFFYYDRRQTWNQ